MRNPFDDNPETAFVIACPDAHAAAAMRNAAKERPDLYTVGLGYWQGEHELSYTMALDTFKVWRDLGAFDGQIAVLHIRPADRRGRRVDERGPMEDFLRLPLGRLIGPSVLCPAAVMAWTLYPGVGYFWVSRNT